MARKARKTNRNHVVQIASDDPFILEINRAASAARGALAVGHSFLKTRLNRIIH